MTDNYFNAIKLIIYDFDGVMTDNKVYIDEIGKEMVQVNRADGLGVSEIKKLHIDQVIVSTERNSVVAARAKKLDISCIHGIDDKRNVILEFCTKKNIDLKNVAFVGNDINDLNAMKLVGFLFCPADAHESIKQLSVYVLKTKGGNGVIREIFDILNE